MIVGFIPGPSYEVFRHHADPRWCFRCRDFLGGDWVLLDEPPERQPTYYEAAWTRRCVRCGEEHMRFPGTADGPIFPPAWIQRAAGPARAAFFDLIDWDAWRAEASAPVQADAGPSTATPSGGAGGAANNPNPVAGPCMSTEEKKSDG